MSPRSPSERLADLRYDARLLLEQTGDQEASLEALVAAAERDIRQSEAALSHSTDLGMDEVQHLLSEPLQRSAAAAVAARRLRASAQQQHAAARGWLARVDGAHTPGGPSPNAVLVVRDARVIAHTGNPSFDESPAAWLFAAVLATPATPETVLATVQRVSCR
jgi:hypothetical protein